MPKVATFRWVTQIIDNNIRYAIEEAVLNVGFEIDEVGTTMKQVSALCTPDALSGYKSCVRLVATWSDQSCRHVKLEVISDEPALRRNTHCELRAVKLKELLPAL